MVSKLITSLILMVLILGLASLLTYKFLPPVISLYEKRIMIIVNKIIKYKLFQNKAVIYIIYCINIFIFVYFFINFVLLFYFVFFLVFCIYILFFVYFFINFVLLLYFEFTLYLIIMIVYPLIFIFTGTLLSQLKSEYKIEINFKLPRFIKENYFFNRITFFFDNTLLHLGIYFLIIYICLSELLTVNIDELS